MRRLWTEDELIKSLKLYCELPFGRLHSKNPEIISLAQMMGRTPSSVALKMVNFASLDPTIKQKGMKKYSKLDKEIWEIFFSNIDLFLSEEDVFLKGKTTRKEFQKNTKRFLWRNLLERAKTIHPLERRAPGSRNSAMLSWHRMTGAARSAESPTVGYWWQVILHLGRHIPRGALILAMGYV